MVQRTSKRLCLDTFFFKAGQFYVLVNKYAPDMAIFIPGQFFYSAVFFFQVNFAFGNIVNPVPYPNTHRHAVKIKQRNF